MPTSLPHRLCAPKKKIRFPAELETRVQALSEKYCVSKSDLIRQALVHQLGIWERSGITLLPIEPERK